MAAATSTGLTCPAPAGLRCPELKAVAEARLQLGALALRRRHMPAQAGRAAPSRPIAEGAPPGYLAAHKPTGGTKCALLPDYCVHRSRSTVLDPAEFSEAPDYPTKPIRIPRALRPQARSVDVAARIIAQKLQERPGPAGHR